MVSTDREALVALYNSTGGDSWRESTNWCTNVDLSQWKGVQLNGEGRVVGLKLPSNNLRGMQGFADVGSTAESLISSGRASRVRIPL